MNSIDKLNKKFNTSYKEDIEKVAIGNKRNL